MIFSPKRKFFFMMLYLSCWLFAWGVCEGTLCKWVYLLVLNLWVSPSAPTRGSGISMLLICCLFLSIRNWEEDVLFLSMNIGFLKYVESVFSLVI